MTEQQAAGWRAKMHSGGERVRLVAVDSVESKALNEMTIGRLDFRNAGISNDQLVQELRAEHRLKEAIDEMHRAIADVNKTSALVEIEPSAFDDS